jgi:uncharacterized membrane protein YsdA (DUF1294 family)
MKIAVFLLINIVAYVTMVWDKLLSKAIGARRVPEQFLFLLALLFGGCGIYLGMRWPWYHKAGKDIFRYGIPLMIAINCVIVWFMA